MNAVGRGASTFFFLPSGDGRLSAHLKRYFKRTLGIIAFVSVYSIFLGENFSRISADILIIGSISLSNVSIRVADSGYFLNQ